MSRTRQDIIDGLLAWSHDERLGDGMLLREAAHALEELQNQFAEHAIQCPQCQTVAIGAALQAEAPAPVVHPWTCPHCDRHDTTPMRHMGDPPAPVSAPMPEIQAGDLLDLECPDVHGWIVGSGLDSVSAWKNPKAANRILTIWRAVWRRRQP